MTPSEILDALCLEAEWCGTYFGVVPEKYEAAKARRDRIKAALVAWMNEHGGSTCGMTTCIRWAKLEEACRGECGSAAEVAKHIPSHWRGYRGKRTKA